MLEWFKLVKICMEKNFKFIKNKWCFYTLIFMKTNVHNQLNADLDLCVRMFGFIFLFWIPFCLMFDETIVIKKK